VQCFRLTLNPDPATAFDGVGASLYPGRWNERNRRVVYVTTSLPLGILEIMVQDSVTSLRGYGAFPVDIPDDIVLETVNRADLSRTWRTARAGRIECRAAGEEWYVCADTVGLVVPSAVVPEAFDFGDFNIVLNPTHTDFARIIIGKRFKLDMDERLQSIIG
jgi:RES domain-containing protein